MVQHSIACVHGVRSRQVTLVFWRHGLVSSKSLVLNFFLFWEGMGGRAGAEGERAAWLEGRSGKGLVVRGKEGREVRGGEEY
jgi:hypothetical protein